MRILFLGDVVGQVGRDAITAQLPQWRKEAKLDFVIVNAENAAGGFGLTAKICDAFFANGVDVLTSGNHIWDQADIVSYIEKEERLLRPLNFNTNAAGRGKGLYQAGDKKVLVLNAQGQIFMEASDDPFAAVNAELEQCALGREADAIIVDFHTEACTEMQAMGYYCDGRASLVIGTHTHVPTADARILPKGTGYQTDAGMCGDYDSIVGFNVEPSLARLLTKRRTPRLATASQAASMCGMIVTTDDATGLAQKVEPVRKGGLLESWKQ